MKNKIILFAIIFISTAILFILTGCEKSETQPALYEEVQNNINSAIEKVSETSEYVYVRELQEELGDKYVILGAKTSSGVGQSFSAKEYIDPNREVPKEELNQSIVDSVDYIFVYEPNSNREFRVRIFRQTDTPLAKCLESDELIKEEK